MDPNFRQTISVLNIAQYKRTYAVANMYVVIRTVPQLLKLN